MEMDELNKYLLGGFHIVIDKRSINLIQRTEISDS